MLRVMLLVVIQLALAEMHGALQDDWCMYRLLVDMNAPSTRINLIRRSPRRGFVAKGRNTRVNSPLTPHLHRDVHANANVVIPSVIPSNSTQGARLHDPGALSACPTARLPNIPERQSTTPTAAMSQAILKGVRDALTLAE